MVRLSLRLAMLAALCGCSTLRYDAALPAKADLVDAGVPAKLPARAALVIPASVGAAVVRTGPLTCPLMNGADVLFPLGKSVERRALPGLAQAFAALEHQGSVAEAAGRYDLIVEVAAQETAFHVSDCSTLLRFAGINFLITPWFTHRPGVWFDYTPRVRVYDAAGARVLAESAEKIGEEAARYGWGGGPEYGNAGYGAGFDELVAKAFARTAADLAGNPRLAAYLADAKRAPAPAAAAAARPLPESDVDSPPTVPAASRPGRHALVVGIEHYRQGLPVADFAARDAESFATSLVKVMGFPEENVAVLTDARAGRADIEKYAEGWLPNRVEKGDTVVVYFSGHGAPDPKTGKAFLVPYDGDPAFVAQTAYPLDRLYAKLEALPASRVLVVLDSCFSGAGGRSVLAKGTRPLVPVVRASASSDKVAVLSATDGAQVTGTFAPGRHGLMTYYLLRGLKGEADADKDGGVTLGELYDYLRPQVERTARRESNNEQTPELSAAPALRALSLTGDGR